MEEGVKCGGCSEGAVRWVMMLGGSMNISKLIVRSYCGQDKASDGV